MDNFFSHLRLYALHSADLQFVPGVHLGNSTAYKCQSECLDHQIYPSESLVQKDTDP